MAAAPPADAGADPGRPRLRLPDRLPHLDGRRGGAVRLLYLAVALAVFVVVAGSFWFNGRDYFGNMPTAAAYGFRTQTTGGAPQVAGALAGSAAERSGLRRGDRIVAIDGEPLPAGATEFTIGDRLARDADGRVALSVRSADGALLTHRLERSGVGRTTREPVTGMPLWLFIALGFTATQLPLVVWSSVSLVLALRRPRDPEAMLFAFAALLICVPAAGFWLTALLGVPRGALETIGNLGAAMLLGAIAGFPDGRFPNRLARLTAAAVMLLALALLVAAAWPGLPLGAAFLACNLALLACVWLRFRRGSSDLVRQQMKWAVFGFAGALALLLPVQVADLLGLLEDDGLASFLAEYVMINLGLLLIPLGLLVSLLRYRLYDAEAAISLSAGYAVLTLMVAATFAAMAKGMEWFFEKQLGRDEGALPGAVAAGLAVALITPLHNRVHRWSEQRFQKSLSRLRRDLPECVADLRETSALTPLLDEVLARLEDGVRATRGAVLLEGTVAAARGTGEAAVEAWLRDARLDEAAEPLECRADDRLFPLRVPLRIRHGSGPALGWILLGPRPDGSLYGRDEREALADIADPVARAVRIVSAREERERRQEARFEALERGLARALKRRTGPASA